MGAGSYSSIKTFLPSEAGTRKKLTRVPSAPGRVFGYTAVTAKLSPTIGLSRRSRQPHAHGHVDRETTTRQSTLLLSRPLNLLLQELLLALLFFSFLYEH